VTKKTGIGTFQGTREMITTERGSTIQMIEVEACLPLKIMTKASLSQETSLLKFKKEKLTR
jgi:hypothetical protein